MPDDNLNCIAPLMPGTRMRKKLFDGDESLMLASARHPRGLSLCFIPGLQMTLGGDGGNGGAGGLGGGCGGDGLGHDFVHMGTPLLARMEADPLSFDEID